MWNRVQRRSERIFVLESRKAAEAKSKSKKNGTGVEGVQETSTTRGPKRKPSRKRKTRPVQDSVDDKFEFEVKKPGTWSGLRYDANAAGMSFEIPLPDKETLLLILDALKKKDSYDIFAKPVDPNQVKDYYDIIEEPMDFSTIAKKIDEGSYKTLNDFEHDLYLVYNNAMYFNALDTIYYKQAVVIRNLVEWLLYVLVTDPENLISECGKKKAINIEKKKDYAKCSNARNETTGWNNEQESENSQPSQHSTYTPHTSFSNESLMSQVLKSSKKLEPENPFKYSKSLMRFAKDLGPTAQTVAMRKIVEGVAETSTHQIAASNSHLQTPSNQIHAATLPHRGINTDLSLFLGHSAGCQRISGREVDLQSNTSKERAFAAENKYDFFQGGIANASSTTKALGDVQGKMIQAPKNQVANGVSVHQSVKVAPPSRFPVLSAGPRTFTGKEFDTRCSTNQDKVNAINISDALSREITQGSSKNKIFDDFQDKMVQTMSGGVGISTAFKESISTAGDRKLSVPEELNTESDPTKFSFVKLLLDDGNSFDFTDEVVSSGSKMQKLVHATYSCPSSSWQWPSQSMTEGSSRGEPVGFMHEGNSHHLGGAHPQAMADGEGFRIGGNIEQGGLVSDLFKLNVSEGSSSTQTFGSVQELASLYPDAFHQIEASTDQSSLIHGGSDQQGDQVSNWFKPVGLGVHEAGSSHSGNVKHGKQIFNWVKPTELALEPIPDAVGPSHGSSIKHGEEISSWFKPTELGLEPIPDPDLSEGGNIELGGQSSSWFKPMVWGLEPIPDAAGLSQGGNVELGEQGVNWFKPAELGVEAIPDAEGLSQGGNFKHGGQISSPLKQAEVELEPFPDAAGLSEGGNLEFGEQSSNWFKPTEPDLEPFPDAAGLSHGGNIELGGQSSDWFKPMELNLEPNPPAGPNHAGNIEDEGQIFDWFKPTEWGLELMPDAAGPNYAGNVNHGGQSSDSFKPTESGLEFIPDTACPNHAGNINHAEQSSNSFKPTESGLELIPYAAGPNHAGNVTHGGQISDSFKLNETDLELIPAAAGSNNADSSKHGELSNFFKPTESGPEPNTDDWLQEQCEQLVEMNMLSQAAPLSLQGWTITPYDEKPMDTPHA